ncbi:MAG TPA: HPP family protein [Lentisphaeria bacterium]|nr:HPP family protein [Lentisphaeria bacterium]
MGTYIDISETDLKNLFEIAFKHIHKRINFIHRKHIPLSPPGVGLKEIAWSGLGSFLGIGLCAFFSYKFLEPFSLTLLIGSFGASAVLIYGAIKSPLAQPRNLIGGHLISALIGVICFQIFGYMIWIAAALSVSIAIMAMLATKTLHPPGGATALIAVIGGTNIHNLGYLYILFPVASGAVILLLVALAINNLAKGRKYPEYWF